MKAETDIFLPCHLVGDLFRLVKVKTDIFIPCHLVGDLLDL